MRLQSWLRWGLLAATAVGFLAISACGSREPEPAASPPKAGGAPARGRAPPPGPLKNEIPGGELAAVMAAHYQGLGHMERYEYREAVEAFREVRKRAPGWIPGSINLAIALLNDSGVKAEEAKKAGVEAAPDNFDEALELLAGVLERDPAKPHAHFCRGIILEQQGNLAEAHSHFKRVTEIDPTDAAAWYWLGRTIPEPANDPRTGRRRSRKGRTEEIEFFTKALELNPYLTPAVYGYAMASRLVKTQERERRVVRAFQTDQPRTGRLGAGAGTGRRADEGSMATMGRYGTIVNPFPKLASSASNARHLRLGSRHAARWT